jgi:hypothetical protein
MGQGGSFEMGRRIFPDFVQVQTVPGYFLETGFQAVNSHLASPQYEPPSCNVQAGVKEDVF